MGRMVRLTPKAPGAEGFKRDLARVISEAKAGTREVKNGERGGVLLTLGWGVGWGRGDENGVLLYPGLLCSGSLSHLQGWVGLGLLLDRGHRRLRRRLRGRRSRRNL